MAKQVDWMRITIRYQRNDDASYTASIPHVEGEVSDPAASTQIDKIPKLLKRLDETYTGTDTLDATVTACFNALKTEGGVA